MARPVNGYKNAAGQPVPGTTDIIGRYKNYSRLMFWAFKRGREGHAELYDRSVLDIGTAVHTMAELDLKGQSDKDIDFYLEATLRDTEHREKAAAAFSAFRQWRAEFEVVAYKQEISLVSEKLQYGGTIDNIAHIRRGRGMIDFKSSTSGEVYEDHILQLAGYDILWEETHPDEPLDEGYHLIVLPKDGSKPVHREFTAEQLHPFKQKFWLYRKAYDLEPVCNDPKLLKGATIKPSKPKARAAASPRPATMAEILRTYGHLQSVEARA